MRIYIAGPISGHPIDETEARFAQYAIDLESAGYEPVNPLWLHGSAEERSAKKRYDIMRTDILKLLDCDAMVLMDDWQTSRGTMVERAVAIACGMKVYHRIEELKREQSHAAHVEASS